jgi:UDP-N-acetylmuramate dehydrogenase
LEYPNAGSVFKRPEGAFPGALIEQAGLKGLRIGGAEISEKHANFIVNRGGASSSDILRLIDIAREEVEKKFGITLETEIIYVPKS